MRGGHGCVFCLKDMHVCVRHALDQKWHVDTVLQVLTMVSRFHKLIKLNLLILSELVSLMHYAKV